MYNLYDSEHIDKFVLLCQVKKKTSVDGKVECAVSSLTLTYFVSENTFFSL